MFSLENVEEASGKKNVKDWETTIEIETSSKLEKFRVWMDSTFMLITAILSNSAILVCNANYLQANVNST